MSENDQEQQGTTWSLVKFQFSVTIGDTEAYFHEVTGLDSETQPIEYRHENRGGFSTIKMPGIQKFGNITLKKGIFKDDKGFKELYEAVKMNVFERKTITISLLDETNEVAMSWDLSNAFPSKIAVTDSKQGTNETAVESMELVHEGIKIK